MNKLRNELKGLSPNSKKLKQYKESLDKLSQVQWEAAIGLILGDGSLQTQNGGKTYRMKFEWGERSKIYLDHVYNLFDEWVLSEPHKKTRISPKGNKITNWGFQTISHEAFNSLAQLFINKNKIISTDLIKNHLTPRGLAWNIGSVWSLIIYVSLLILITALIFNMNFDNILYTLSIVPVRTYTNADTLKELAIQENKGRSGVYRWRHLITGKTYVGSSINLGRRFRDYYNYSFITHEKNKSMIIYKALLKHGYSLFKLEILEYCDVDNIRDREQYYLDTLKPEYNLLPTAGSSLGFKHSEGSLAKVRKHLAKLNAEKGFKVEVLDTKTNTTVVYDSAMKAAKAIGCDKSTILYQEKRLAKGRLDSPLLKKRYVIKIMR